MPLLIYLFLLERCTFDVNCSGIILCAVSVVFVLCVRAYLDVSESRTNKGKRYALPFLVM